MSSPVFTLVYALFLPSLLVGAGLSVQLVDRRLHARLQNRVGPPWYQPLADNLKLFTKRELVPAGADRLVFKLAPYVGLASAMTAFLFVPVWGTQAVLRFPGDAVVVLYLLTVPTLCFFLGGWFSTSLFAGVGAVRMLTALFAYEVPLVVSLLAPSLLAGSWSLSAVAAFYRDHPLLALCNLPSFGVAMVALLGKLEKAPFDIPEAETELAGGAFVEYSGRLLALLRVTLDVEAVVMAVVLAAVFLPWGLAAPGTGPIAMVTGLALTMIKVLGIVVTLTVVRTVFARLRIEQMVDFCWKVVVPVALLQLLADLVIAGGMSS